MESRDKDSPIALSSDLEQGSMADGVTEKHLEKHHVFGHVDDLSQVEASRGWFGSLTRLARFLRVEERGIERVREEDRVRQNPIDGFTMWASANFT